MAILQFPNEKIRQTLLRHYNTRLAPEDRYDLTTPSYFDNVPTQTQYGVLYDHTRINALLFNKIDITDVIDFPVDITPFKSNTGQVTDRQLIDFASNPIKGDEFQYFTLMHNKDYLPNFTYSAMKKFITFIRLVGLSELSLDDVYLTESPQKLWVEISRTHPIYTGKIEVTTW